MFKPCVNTYYELPYIYFVCKIDLMKKTESHLGISGSLILEITVYGNPFDDRPTVFLLVLCS